jgi:thymidylate synthase (FAD)
MTKVEFVDKVSVTLIEAAASDSSVAMAAWVSNDADSEERLEDLSKVAGLLKFLYRESHMSPFEHGHFTFKVDVPLFVAREWQRHRTQSYNEVSGRYTVMKPRFFMADEVRVQKGKMGNYHFEPGTPDQYALYRRSKEIGVQSQWDIYEQRLEAGIAKEQAREDLPLSLMTQFYATMNPRNLMQFLKLRNEDSALKEIRQAAVQIEEVFANYMPMTYAAYVEVKHPAIVVDLKENKFNEQETAKNVVRNLNNYKDRRD